jgi:hypothetical protein
MYSGRRTVAFFFALGAVSRCDATKANEQTPLVAPGLPRPNQIWVYDFVAASSDMPPDSSLAGEVSAPSTPPTLEEIQTRRRLGALIAQNLVKDIQAMGLLAVEARPGSSPQVGDGVIRGYIVSTEGGGLVARRSASSSDLARGLPRWTQ